MAYVGIVIGALIGTAIAGVISITFKLSLIPSFTIAVVLSFIATQIGSNLTTINQRLKNGSNHIKNIKS